MKSIGMGFWEWYVRSTLPCLLISYGMLDFFSIGRFIFIPISLFTALITLIHFKHDLKNQKDVEVVNEMKLGFFVGIFVSFSSVLVFIYILNFLSI